VPALPLVPELPPALAPALEPPPPPVPEFVPLGLPPPGVPPDPRFESPSEDSPHPMIAIATSAEIVLSIVFLR
jgi:hypothetical protein